MRRWTWMCAGLALAVAQAGIVEETHSKPVLAASLEVAPLAEIRQKLQAFGTLVNNPIVPMALVPAIQSAIEDNMGNLRPDAAIKVCAYVYQPAWQIAVTSEVAYAAEELMKTEVVYIDPPKSPRPLVCAEITAAGLVALDDYLTQSEEEDRRARKEMGDEARFLDVWSRLGDENRDPALEVDLHAYARAVFTLDLDRRLGLTLDSVMEPQPGANISPVAGARLPAGALDGVPDDALAVLAFNERVAGMCRDEKEWKTSCESSARIVEGLAHYALRQPGARKYEPVLGGLAGALAAYVRNVPFPALADWGVCALALGPRREPFFVYDGVSSVARELDAADARFLDAVAAAVEKQWPGCGLARASSGRLTVDYAAVLDVAAAEAGVKGANRELAKAKQRLGAILGSTTGELTLRPQAGKAHSFILGPAGFHRPVSQKPTGEARLAAALPEAVSDRPSCLFLLSFYALACDCVLPVAAEFAPKRDQALYRTIAQALPKAELGSAVAGAYWARADGSHRFLLRITVEELKNYGAVYNGAAAAWLRLGSFSGK